MSPRSSRLLALFATPALLFALVACSPGGPGDAGADTSSATDAPTTQEEFEIARDDYDRNLAECFRDKGLDVKDPEPGEGITEDGPEIQEAFPECSAEVGDPPSGEAIEIRPGGSRESHPRDAVPA